MKSASRQFPVDEVISSSFFASSILYSPILVLRNAVKYAPQPSFSPSRMPKNTSVSVLKQQKMQDS